MQLIRFEFQPPAIPWGDTPWSHDQPCGEKSERERTEFRQKIEGNSALIRFRQPHPLCLRREG